jgi:perosamine synthetase
MIPLFKVHTPDNIGQELQKVFDSGFISEGEQSDKFEQEFSNYIGNKEACLVNSCTSALTLSYDLSGVGPGKEVISTPMTCMATNEPIQTMGAKIVWADIDPTTGNIDPESVKKKINKNTAAIVGVHWSGIPFEIDAINEIANENGIKVIEDAAHALGSKYNGKLIGNHGDYVCFSFQAIKHLTTGDGGAIATNNNDSSLIRKLRWFGLDRKYKGSKWEQDIERSGYKFHMNNINATIGLCQMPYLNMIVSSHIENGKFYDENIKNNKITTLKKQSHVESASWIYSILVDDRQSLKKHLYDHGIASDVVHVRNDKYTVFKDYFSGDLQGCDEFCSKLLNIPVGWWVSEEDREYIVSVLNKWDNK